MTRNVVPTLISAHSVCSTCTDASIFMETRFFNSSDSQWWTLFKLVFICWMSCFGELLHLPLFMTCSLHSLCRPTPMPYNLQWHALLRVFIPFYKQVYTHTNWIQTSSELSCIYRCIQMNLVNPHKLKDYHHNYWVIAWINVRFFVLVDLGYHKRSGISLWSTTWKGRQLQRRNVQSRNHCVEYSFDRSLYKTTVRNGSRKHCWLFGDDNIMVDQIALFIDVRAPFQQTFGLSRSVGVLWLNVPHCPTWYLVPPLRTASVLHSQRFDFFKRKHRSVSNS